MKSAMRFFPLRRDSSELGKDIDKAGFLILHDKSYNPEACQQCVHRTAGTLRVLPAFSWLGQFPVAPPVPLQPPITQTVELTHSLLSPCSIVTRSGSVDRGSGPRLPASPEEGD